MNRIRGGPSTGLFDAVGQQLVTPPIRGRADELELIGALVAELVQGRGGVLVIEGPPGIGKSRLLTEVLALAEKAGIRTLFGEAFEYQQTVPFFSLFMATLNADPPVADAEALRRLGGSADLRYWVVHDLADAIRAASAEAPLAIVLEDIHWADNGTALALRSLATVRPDVAVLWVLTARTGAGSPAVQETLSMLHRANASFVRLAAMTPDAVADMVCDAVRARPDAPLLDLAAKAHGNPFLVTELVGGLGEEGRLTLAGGRAMVTGDGLPRRLGAAMHQRLDLLSGEVSEVVRVAAVLPDRFSAGLLAAMLDRQPVSLLSALEEAVRADLLVEDGERLRFRHDLLREATRQSLPQSLRRAMERQSASVMLGMGAAPTEVATQLARSAEPGDREAIDALRQAARSVGRGDASVAADLCKRALELLPADDAEHGSLVAETVELLNRASRYSEAEEVAVAALAEAASPEEEAEIRLRLPTINMHNAQRRVAENRRALQLGGINEVTRARHLAMLAYNLLFDQRGQYPGAADEAAAAAAATGDLESKIVADVTLACLDCGNGYAGGALRRLEEACTLARGSDSTTAHDLLEAHHANLLAVVGQLDDAAAQIANGTERARRERNVMALDIWANIDAWVHHAAGRLSAARADVESLLRPQRTGATDLDMIRMAMLAEVAVHTDDRNLLQQMANDARNAYPTGASTVRRAAAHVLALAAWQRDDVHDAVRWLGGDMSLLATPMTPEVLDLVILAARVASAAGDAGLRARVLQATEVLECERPPVPLLAGVAGYARGILERDAQALVAAAESLHSSARPLLYASAAEDAGDELARAQRNADALEQLNAAFDSYIECGAIADARRVGRALRRLGVERRIATHPRTKTGWDSLTDSELTVINLIAQGATNRDVATELHLSPHTVKTHVRHAFAKLGVTSRAQLAQLMRGAD